MTDRVGAVLVLREDGAALLQLRDDKPGLRNAGLWVPPGGHVDEGETMIECARRELREETDYDAPGLNYLLEADDTVDGWPPYLLVFFWCMYDGRQPVVCREGQALKFVKRSAAEEHLVPSLVITAWDAALAAAGAVNKLISK